MNPWHRPHTNLRFVPKSKDEPRFTPWNYGWSVKDHVATIDPVKGIDSEGRRNIWRTCQHEWCADQGNAPFKWCLKCGHELYPPDSPIDLPAE